MVLLISFLPLLCSLITGLGSSFIGRKGSCLISISTVLLCFLISCFLFFKIITLQYQFTLTVCNWINSGVFYCDWAFLIDTLTIIMLVMVTGISLLVHIYSYGYMNSDPHLSRFMTYLTLFTFFMIILITANNFIQMFIGWEGVGFCSYLLINFWYTRLQANKAAIKAMVINRISDFFLIIGLLIIFRTFRSLDYGVIFPSVLSFNQLIINFLTFEINIIDTICFFLFVGAMGKSAQLFLHTWLPDAMEGPTPVSALIHAATMVTAGVFLLARCSPLYEFSPTVLNFIVIIGSITALFAGTVGLVQNDLKKVIAYSTCSQLGYMMFACGLSNYNVGIFHLFNHAFFKALLFLSAGSVIHALCDEQDMRKMGGLRRLLPYTYVMFIIGSLALTGFPFLTGFYSKDAILELSYSYYTNISHFAYWLGTLAACCTAFYSMRILFLVFLSKTNSFKQIIKVVHESQFIILLPLSVLAFGSICIGYLFKDMFIGFGSDVWGNSIFVLPNNLSGIDLEFIPLFYKLLPLILSCISMVIAFLLYNLYLKQFYLYKISIIGRFIYNFLNRKWFFDKLYHEIVSQNILNFSYYKTYKLIDKGFIEFLGPFGFSYNIYNTSKQLSLLQTGYIYNYSFIMLISLLLFINFLLFNPIFFIFIFLYLLLINITLN